MRDTKTTPRPVEEIAADIYSGEIAASVAIQAERDRAEAAERERDITPSIRSEALEPSPDPSTLT